MPAFVFFQRVAPVEDGKAEASSAMAMEIDDGEEKEDPIAQKSKCMRLPFSPSHLLTALHRTQARRPRVATIRASPTS